MHVSELGDVIHKRLCRFPDKELDNLLRLLPIKILVVTNAMMLFHPQLHIDWLHNTAGKHP